MRESSWAAEASTSSQVCCSSRSPEEARKSRVDSRLHEVAGAAAGVEEVEVGVSGDRGPAPLPASSRELALELFRSISTALSPSGAAASRMELRELGSEGSNPAIHCIQ